MGEPSKKSQEINEQQDLFCREYIVDFNSKEAAIRAGYSQQTAAQQGSRLLSHVKIHHRIAELLGERFEATDLSVDFVLNAIRDFYYKCAGIVPIKTENGKGTRYIFNSRGAGKALELLGKYFKMYTENINLGATNSLASIMKELAEGKKKDAVQ